MGGKLSEGDNEPSQSGDSPDVWRSFDAGGPAWSVDVARMGTTDAVVCGCANGELRVWSLDGRNVTERRAIDHAGSILSVVHGRVDGRRVVVTGGVDSRIRVWGLDGGDKPIDTMGGHVGAIRALAFGQSAASPAVASAGADASVRVWDLRSHEQTQQIDKAHAGSALAVVFADVGGQPILVSGGDDAQIRRWSPQTGELIGAPLDRHRGAIRALAFTSINDQPVLASASDDGSIRLWDLREGYPLFSPLLGHEGVVRSVSFMKFGEVDVLVSGGIDGTIRFWDPRTGTPFPSRVVVPNSDVRSIAIGDGDDPRIAVGGGVGVRYARLRDLIEADRVFASDIDRSAVVSADQVEASDVLGRKVLARHLRGVIEQFMSPVDGAVQSQSSVVISIDGRWGSGKTTLVRLLEEDLREPSNALEDVGASRTLGPRLADPSLVQPVMVHFDAWRESAIAPHWWAMMSAVNREIRRRRSLVSRLWMSIAGFARTIMRSPATLAAVLITIALGVGMVALRSAAPSEVASVLESVQILVTVVTALFATVAVATRSLVWSSPALGRFHVRADDNPLGEVADMVIQLRKWSPRTRSSPTLETGTAAVLLISVGIAIRIALGVPGVFHVPVIPDRYLVGVGTGLLLCLLIWLSAPSLVPRRRNSGGDHAPDQASARTAGEEPTQDLAAWRLFAVALGVVAAAVVSLIDVPADVNVARVTLVLCGLGVAASISILAYYRRSPRFGERRPVVLVIDELDRCPAPIVVAYLETVHTLLRNSGPGSRRYRRKWQEPAPLIVLALADGRWVRTAFTTEYGDYRELGSPVRSLGGDFLQKLFDHTVLVPELNVDQIKQMVGEATRTGVSAASAPSDADSAVATVGHADIPEEKQAPLESASALHAADGEQSNETELVGSGLTPQDRMRDAVDAATAAVRPATMRAREAHLLSTYSSILPANPRLIRRVINTWGMLEAIKSHTGHEEPDEVMVRAAIAYVTFPSLVDELLSAPWPPALPSHVRDVPDARDDAWLRPDVIGLLSHENGSLVAPEDIAACFGKAFPGNQLRLAGAQPLAEAQATELPPTSARPTPSAVRKFSGPRVRRRTR